MLFIFQRLHGDINFNSFLADSADEVLVYEEHETQARYL